MKKLPSLETCRNLFDYDPETGLFVWRYRAEVTSRWNGQHAGKAAFTCKDKDGYLISKFINPETGLKEKYLAARIAWLMATGNEPDFIVDHFNHIRHDNRFANLRQASSHQNRMNTTKNQGTSIYQGVHLHRKTGKWRAMAGHNHVGVFDNEFDAAVARDAAVLLRFGQYANLNFP